MVTSAGITLTGSVSLNGTTPVALNASTAIVQIVDLYLSAVAVGTVTATQGSGGTVLATIAIGATAQVSQQIALLPTPASVLTYTLQYERLVQPLVNANDQPVLPAQFHRLIGVGVRMREAEYKDDASRRVMTTQEYLTGIGLLNSWVVSGPDQTYIPGRRRSYPSVLGGWTPSPPYRGY
jgi:hypothetical protein